MSEKSSQLSEITRLVEEAPSALARTDRPSILTPDLFQEIRSLDYYSPQSNYGKSTIRSLRKAENSDTLANHFISAKDMLTLGLETPKNVHLKYGDWYLNTIDELYKMISIQKFGRDASSNHSTIGDDPASMFYRRSQQWRTGTLQEATRSGNLWEFGIILEEPDNHLTIFSLSVPYDGKRISWHERLTPEEIFVGREAELNFISQMLTGMSNQEAKVARAFTSDDVMVWWGQAIKVNTILRGQYEKINMQIRPDFYEKIISRLQNQVTSNQLHKVVNNATSISGYFITAGSSEFPGVIDLSLRLDNTNWLEPYSYKFVGSSEEKENHNDRRWVYGSGYLYNDENKEKDGSSGVYIQIADAIDPQNKNLIVGSVGVSHISVYQHRRFNNISGRKHYYVNHPEFGDSVTYHEGIISNQKVSPLTEKDWRKILELFNLSLKRGVTDQLSNEAVLSAQTQAILKNAQALIYQKIDSAGIKI